MSVREAQDLEARIRELGLLDPTDRRMRRPDPRRRWTLSGASAPAFSTTAKGMPT